MGAGVALSRAGMKGLILEQEKEVGGLCRNQTVHGCDFDFGPKILILDESENSRDVLSFLGGNYERYPMRESLYLKDYGILDFPLQRNLIDLPQPLRQNIVKDIISIRRKRRRIQSYKDFLINSYGKILSDMALIPYEEKKWGMDLKNMSYEWALQRPVSVDLEEIIEGSTRKLPAQRYYYYPRRGNISIVSQSMGRSAGDIVTTKRVTEINLEQKTVTAGGDKYSYTYLISTLPLDYFAEISCGLPSELQCQSKKILKRLSIMVFNLVFKGMYDIRESVVYFPEKDFVFRRVSVLQNLCPALSRPGYTPISVETSIDKQAQTNEADLFALLCAGLESIPQFKVIGKPIDHAVITIDFAYPLQIIGLSSHLELMRSFLEGRKVFLCGRGGTFSYCNSDQAYKQGKETIERLLKQAH